jgi:hypothetical protein
MPASVVLKELHAKAPAGHVTLDWLLGSLPRHSFGLIMLLLAIVAAAPGICLIAGLLLIILAFQMIAGYPAPSFPSWITTRPLPTRHLGAVMQRAIPVLGYLEKAVHPRCPAPLIATRHVVAIAVMLLSVRLILVPIPLSNVLPALVMVLISLAYLEEDGLVLSIGLLTGFAVLAVDLWLVREMALGAKGIDRFW